MTPPGGLGVERSMPASFNASELATAMCPQVRVSKIGCSVRKMAAFGQKCFVVAHARDPTARWFAGSPFGKALDDGRNVGCDMNAHIDQMGQEQAQPTDMNMGVVEAGNQRAPCQINLFGVGTVESGEFADSSNATVVVGQHSFGVGKVWIDGVDGAVVEEFHTRLDCL